MLILSKFLLSKFVFYILIWKPTGKKVVQCQWLVLNFGNFLSQKLSRRNKLIIYFGHLGVNSVFLLVFVGKCGYDRVEMYTRIFNQCYRGVRGARKLNYTSQF